MGLYIILKKKTSDIIPTYIAQILVDVFPSSMIEPDMNRNVP